MPRNMSLATYGNIGVNQNNPPPPPPPQAPSQAQRSVSPDVVSKRQFKDSSGKTKHWPLLLILHSLYYACITPLVTLLPLHALHFGTLFELAYLYLLVTFASPFTFPLSLFFVFYFRTLECSLLVIYLAIR